MQCEHWNKKKIKKQHKFIQKRKHNQHTYSHAYSVTQNSTRKEKRNILNFIKMFVRAATQITKPAWKQQEKVGNNLMKLFLPNVLSDT